PKQFVQIRGRSVIGQQIKSAVCFDVLGGAEERAPRREGKSRADRNAAHTEISQLRERKLMIESGDKNVDRFRPDGLHNLCNLISISNAGRIETVSAGFGVSSESFERSVQWVGIPDQPRFATPG